MRRGGPPARVTVWIDGEAAEVIEGQTVAAVLVERARWQLNRHVVTAAARGPYCGMGVCFDCVVRIDGRAGVRSCMTRARDGMRIETVDEGRHAA
jgi:predicted molibdopterin-dependent oxidoreductase YjgC